MSADVVFRTRFPCPSRGIYYHENVGDIRSDTISTNVAVENAFLLLSKIWKMLVNKSSHLVRIKHILKTQTLRI